MRFIQNNLKDSWFMKFYSNALHLFLVFFISSLTISSYAQSCKATAPERVAVGQNFNYSIVLDEKATQILAVALDQFSVLAGPNQSFSSSTSYINGQVTQSTTYTYSYTLQAKKTGTFTIAGAVVNVGGKKLKTNAITITVSDAPASANQPRGSSAATPSADMHLDKNSVFVKAFISNSSPYEGEEVVVTHKIYISDQINGGYQITGVNQPTQNGFWAYTLGDPQAQPPQSVETIDGKRYTVFEIRKTALYPQKSGYLTVSPLEVDFVGRIVYRVQTNNIWDDFFGGGQRVKDEEFKLKSNSLQLQVKKLPEANKPADFSGIVGQFDMTAKVNRSELKENEALNFTMTLTGKGNLQHIDKLQIHFPSEFDVFDPQINDNIHTTGNYVNGSRTFEYVIIPRTEGTFTLGPASFSFFDPKTKSYKTLSTDSFTIQVAKGSGESGISTSITHQRDIKVLGNDIRFIKTEGRVFHPIQGAFFLTPLYFAILLLPLLIFVLFIVIWRKKIEEQRNLALHKNKRANRVAKKRLKRANKLLINKEKDAFYVEISQVLWGYMSDKFHIPLAQLSMDSVEERLKGKNIDEESIRDFLATLENCEYARFAPGDSSEMMHNLYNLSLQFITKIERKS